MRLNTKYLNKIVNKKQADYLYHFGISSSDKIIEKLRNIKAIVLSGSPVRTKNMTLAWSKQNNNAKIIKFPKDERFSTFYTHKVLFSSHGMGMPSMSIALQELMKLLYVVKEGKLSEIQNIFWARIGTSGGLTDAGSIVITTQAFCSDLKPYRQYILGKEFIFKPDFPKTTIDNILRANKHLDLNIITGKTIGANSFYIEQNRTDGAISFCDNEEKLTWLKTLQRQGFQNIEMETPMMAGLLNYAGFTNFTAICAVLINRLNVDQVSTSPEKIKQYQLNAQKVLWNYLKNTI